MIRPTNVRVLVILSAVTAFGHFLRPSEVQHPSRAENQQDVDITRPLDQAESEWLRRAEDHALDIVQARYGNVQFARTAADLDLIQRIIDEKAVRPDQVLELQCLGVVLGNVFVAQNGLRWVNQTNSFGSLIALHHDSSGFTLYPITMILKRVQDGREIDVLSLYRSMVRDLESNQ